MVAEDVLARSACSTWVNARWDSATIGWWHELAVVVAVWVAVGCGAVASTAVASRPTDNAQRSDGRDLRRPGILVDTSRALAGSTRACRRRPCARVTAPIRSICKSSNYSQRADIVRPEALGRLLDAAPRCWARVVALVPALVCQSGSRHPALARRNPLPSASGEHFDSFALDIESQPRPSLSLRNARLVGHSRPGCAPPHRPHTRSARSSPRRSAWPVTRTTGRTSPTHVSPAWSMSSYRWRTSATTCTSPARCTPTPDGSCSISANRPANPRSRST